MAFLDPLHPRFVHFPVALLATGSVVALVYLLGWRRNALPGLAWAMLLLGWLGIFPAMLSGLFDRNRAPADSAITAVMNPHIAASFGLLIIYGLLVYERLRSPDVLDQPRRRWVLIGLLALGLALLVVVGWLGGKLVYDLGVGVQQ
jgi:uncharacterized membrane protein